MPRFDDLVTYLNNKTSVQHIEKDVICFDQKFYLDDGTSQIIKLEVHSKNHKLHVKAADHRFPNFCPNRHINYEGFFCLGLDSDIENLSINQWLKLLKDFLATQYECEISKEWSTKQWAHGDGAIYQRKVEEFYQKFITNPLGIKLSDLDVNEITTKGKVLYHLYLKGNLILIGDENKVLNKRYTCICDSCGLKKHRTIGKCSLKCAQVLYIVAINDFFRLRAEKEFWQNWTKSGKVKCCNTMKNCELNFKKGEIHEYS